MADVLPMTQAKTLDYSREYCQRRGFAIAGEYVDNGISGITDRRPQLDRLFQAARTRQVDPVLVWKLDRFERSMKQLVLALEELSGLGGVGFISYQDNLDLTTPQGRLMFHIIGAMAEFEREPIRERVKDWYTQRTEERYIGLEGRHYHT